MVQPSAEWSATLATTRVSEEPLLLLRSAKNENCEPENLKTFKNIQTCPHHQVVPVQVFHHITSLSLPPSLPLSFVLQPTFDGRQRERCQLAKSLWWRVCRLLLSSSCRHPLVLTCNEVSDGVRVARSLRPTRCLDFQSLMQICSC